MKAVSGLRVCSTVHAMPGPTVCASYPMDIPVMIDAVKTRYWSSDDADNAIDA